MNKKLIFLTFLFLAIVTVTVYAQPHELSKIDPGYAFHRFVVGSTTWDPRPFNTIGNGTIVGGANPYGTYQFYLTIAIVPVNKTAEIRIVEKTINDATPILRGTITLSPGIYIFAPFFDTGKYVYIYIYKYGYGLLTYYKSLKPFSNSNDYIFAYFIGASGDMYTYTTYSGATYDDGKRDLVSKWLVLVTDLMNTLSGSSMYHVVILFNMTGNQPLVFNATISGVSAEGYSLGSSTNKRLIVFGGGPPTIGILIASAKWVQVIGSVTHNFTPGFYIVTDNNWYRYNMSQESQPQPQENQTVKYFTLNVTTIPRDYTIAFYYNGVQDASGIGTLSKQYVNGSHVEYRIYRQGQLVYSNTVVMTRDYTFVHNFGSQLPSGNYTLTLYFYEYSPESGTVRGSVPVDKVVVRDSQNRIVRTAENVAQAVFSLNAGVYSITITKQGFYDTFMQVTLDQDRTFHVYLVRAGEYYGNTKPPTVISPEELTNETAKETHDTLHNATNIPAPPPPEDNWYGFHIIVLDPQTRQLSNKPTPVTIYLLKGINRILWQDQIEIPIRNIEVRGQAYVALGLTEIKETLRKQAWESFNGFKIVSGDNVMFVPESSARQRYFEIIIYEGGNLMLGVTDTKYSGPFSNFDWTNILTLLPLLIVLILIIKLLDVL